MRRIVSLAVFAALFAAPQILAESAFGVLGRPVAAEKLRDFIETRREKFPALKKMAEIIAAEGLRGWMWGGTAAGFLHDSRWNLLAEQFPEAFVPGRLGDHLDVVFRSTQDFDLAIDGGCDEANRLQGKLLAAMPGLKFEVRPLHYRCDDKDALLSPDVLEQNGDTGSTGLIELTATPRRESFLRDLKTFHAPKAQQGGPFLEDGARARIRYLPSATHDETRRAKLGENPEILSVVRILVKASQYGLAIDASDWRILEERARRFLPQSLPEGYARRWLRRQGRKVVMHSLDMALAFRWLDDLGLRTALLSLGTGSQKTSSPVGPDDDADYWLQRAPLPHLGKPKPAPPGTPTAASMEIEHVTHGTPTLRAWEAITWNPTGKLNFIVTDYHFPPSVFTMPGSQGVYLYPVHMRLHPDAIAGKDFLRHGSELRLLNADAVTLESRAPMSLPEVVLRQFAWGSKEVGHYLPRLKSALASATFPWTAPEWETLFAQVPTEPEDTHGFERLYARSLFAVAMQRREQDGGQAAQRVYEAFSEVPAGRSLGMHIRDLLVAPANGFSDDERTRFVEEVFRTQRWRKALRSGQISLQLAMLNEMSTLARYLTQVGSRRALRRLQKRQTQFADIWLLNLRRRLAGKTLEQSLEQLEALLRGVPSHERNILSRLWPECEVVFRENAEREVGDTTFLRRSFQSIARSNAYATFGFDKTKIVLTLRSLAHPDAYSSQWRVAAVDKTLQSPLLVVRGQLLWVNALQALAVSPSWSRDFGMERVKRFFARYFRNEEYLDHDMIEDFFEPRKEFRRLDVYRVWKRRQQTECAAALGS